MIRGFKLDAVVCLQGRALVRQVATVSNNELTSVVHDEVRLASGHEGAAIIAAGRRGADITLSPIQSRHPSGLQLAGTMAFQETRRRPQRLGTLRIQELLKHRFHGPRITAVTGDAHDDHSLFRDSLET